MAPTVERKQIPNLVTGTRLLAIPILWVFALTGHHLVVGAGLFFAWVTDALDGFLARKLDAESARGSQFDSIADTLIFLSGVIWVAMLRPEFIVDHAWLLGIWLALGAAGNAVSWVRFRRLPDVHLLSAKTANYLGFLFGAYLIAFGTYAPAVAYLVLGVALIAGLETLLVVATFEEVDESILTVFQRPPEHGR